MQAGGHVGCCSVFNKMGWVCHPLTALEFLRAYNIPLCMGLLLIGDNHTQVILVRGLSPLVVTAIFCAIWSRGQRGGERVEQGQHISASALPSGTAGSGGSPGGKIASDVDLNGSSECRASPSAVDDTPLVCAEPSQPTTQASIVDHWASLKRRTLPSSTI
jgi:hypothetical protein